MSVYNPENFSGRVDYAVTGTLRGTDSRHFDTCFEMGDGDAVMLGVLRRAAKNSRLAAALPRRFAPHSLDRAALEAQCNGRPLAAWARDLRAQAAARFDAFMAKNAAEKELT